MSTDILIAIALFLYYSAQLGGALVLMTRLMRRILPLPELPGYIHLLLGLGLFPVLVTWAGENDVVRAVPILPCILGAVFATFGVCMLILAYPSLKTRAKNWIASAGRWEWGLALFAFISVAVFMTSHYCYFLGGYNTTDESVRGMPFTAAFAANWLKPAFPVDLSVPISYGYYYYQWSAFLYSSVNGYSWASLALLPISIMASTSFYIFLPLLFAPFIDMRLAKFALLLDIAVSCAGPDYLFNRQYIATWPSDWYGMTYQLMQIANEQSWEYHYLVGTVFELAALFCLRPALNGGSPRYLIASAMLLFFSLGTATISGTFFAMVAVMAACVLVAYRRLRLTTVFWALPYTLLSGFFILWPQKFTFVGRERYLYDFGAPMLWWKNGYAREADLLIWGKFISQMLVFMGPLLFVGLLACPFYLYSIRRDAYRISVMGSLFVMIILGMSCIRGGSFDWYVRGGQASLVFLTAFCVAWLFQKCSESEHFRRPAMVLFPLITLSVCGNFFIENRVLFKSCMTPFPWIGDINRQVDLHTAIVPNVQSPKICMAGRVTAQRMTKPYNININVYRYNTRILVAMFGPNAWKKPLDPCHESWFGTSIPGKSWVDAAPAGQLAGITEHTCDTTDKADPANKPVTANKPATTDKPAATEGSTGR